MTAPPTEQQLTPDREQKIRRNYADSQLDGTVPLLLGEIDRLRTESAQLRAARDVIASMHRDSDARHDAVAAFLDEQERAARLFELPTPEWVEAVRAASAPPTAPLGASQGSSVSEVAQSAAGAPTGALGDSGEAGR